VADGVTWPAVATMLAIAHRIVGTLTIYVKALYGAGIGTTTDAALRRAGTRSWIWFPVGTRLRGRAPFGWHARLVLPPVVALAITNPVA